MPNIGTSRKSHRGVVLVFFMVILLVMTLVGISAITISRQHEMTGRSQESSFKAYQLAKAGLARAISMLDARTTGCTILGSTIGTQTLGSGQYSVSGVFNSLENNCTITALGGEPSLSLPVSLRTLKTKHPAVSFYLAFAGAENDVLFGFNGTVWSSVGSAGVEPPRSITAISCPAYMSCLAVATSGKAASYDGTTWTKIQQTGTNYDFNDVACIGENNCYALDSKGDIFQYNGSTLYRVYDGMEEDELLGIACPGANECWAVGKSNDAFHYNGSGWHKHEYALPISTLNDIACPNSTDCWGVNNGSQFVHYNGSTWTLSTVSYAGGGLNSANFILSAISCLGSNNCWAVGRSQYTTSSAVGIFLHYNGINWTFHSALASTNTDLNDVKCFDDNDCWAVGNNGEFYHYGGTDWVLTQQKGTDDVLCISH